MRNINIFETDMFPYLEGEEIKGADTSLTIKDIKRENLKSSDGRQETKEVLYFAETRKGFVLNKTNAKRIAQMYGPMTGQWEGKLIALTTEPINAFGETHNALRVVLGAIGTIPEQMSLDTLWEQLNRVERIRGFYKTPADVLNGRAEGTQEPDADDLEGWRQFYADARDFALESITQALEEDDGPMPIAEAEQAAMGDEDVEALYPEIFTETE